MQAFYDGEIKLLVATTVIEVGVNVPNASMMVIEHAQQFGLAQLHQLRGRIGRGEYASYCVLVADGKTESSRERMRIMESTSDGFVLAEEDLKLRGPGQFFGTMQHGFLLRSFPSSLSRVPPPAGKGIIHKEKEQPDGCSFVLYSS